MMKKVTIKKIFVLTIISMLLSTCISWTYYPGQDKTTSSQSSDIAVQPETEKSNAINEVAGTQISEMGSHNNYFTDDTFKDLDDESIAALNTFQKMFNRPIKKFHKIEGFKLTSSYIDENGIPHYCYSATVNITLP